MKRWTLLGVIVVVGFLAAYLAAQRPAEPTVERLADNLIVIKDEDDGNTAVFVRDAGVVLVDTKSLKHGQRFLNTLRTVTTKPVTHILNTHHHYDHTGGNSYFESSVEVIVHENAAKRMPAAAALSGIRSVIPGHGPVMTWQQFVDNVASLRTRP